MPLMTLALILANLLAYSLELVSGGRVTCEQFGLIPAHFVPSALVTSTFLHDPAGLSHIAGNMIFLLVFGAIVEREIGGFFFLALYFAAGAVGGLFHVAVSPTDTAPLVGASTAVCGVLAVAGALNPRLLGFVGCFMAFNIWEAVTGTGGSVAVCGHIGGFCFGAFFAFLMRASNLAEERFA